MTLKGRPRFSTLAVRKFDGVLYHRTYHFMNKSQADKYAANVRKTGVKARVVTHKGVFTVYKSGVKKQWTVAVLGIR